MRLVLMRLILASTSPRRQELLRSLQVPFETVAPSFVEYPTDFNPAEEALFFAEQKARSVAQDFPECLILGSDTLIECEGEKIGKPLDERDAVGMLQQLSGKTHQVHTAVVLLDTKNGTLQRHLETAAVTFQVLTESQIVDYVATGEPMGKAGGYAIQGEGRMLIAKVEGDEEAVIGLPLAPIRRWLEKSFKSLFQ